MISPFLPDKLNFSFYQFGVIRGLHGMLGLPAVVRIDFRLNLRNYTFGIGRDYRECLDFRSLLSAEFLDFNRY
ncbi:hypothetical protein D3C80_2194270 [compost metagenome]